VPFVEEGWFDHPALELVAREYLQPLLESRMDALVLGCTHYPLIKPLLQRVTGPGVRLIDSAEETARALAEILQRDGLQAPPAAVATHRFVVSDDEGRFRTVGARFIGERLDRAEVVAVG
jgi:glutamate racemase